jgi:hypothetical protein
MEVPLYVHLLKVNDDGQLFTVARIKKRFLVHPLPAPKGQDKSPPPSFYRGKNNLVEVTNGTIEPLENDFVMYRKEHQLPFVIQYGHNEFTSTDLDYMHRDFDKCDFISIIYLRSDDDESLDRINC